MARLIGLTGQTGAGKSHAAALFAQEGFAVLDCDRIARQVTQDGSGCLAALTEAFSPEILNPDGSLNRRRLGGMVFSDPALLERLNQVIFPFIRAEIDRQAARLAEEGASWILLDAPTLFESGADRQCEAVIAVTAPEGLRKARIMARDSISGEAASTRMKAQLSEGFFRTHADYLIENSSTEEELRRQVSQTVAALRGGGSAG